MNRVELHILLSDGVESVRTFDFCEDNLDHSLSYKTIVTFMRLELAEIYLNGPVLLTASTLARPLRVIELDNHAPVSLGHLSSIA